jgi:hypothetical protein
MHILERAIDAFPSQQAFAKALGKINKDGEGAQSYVSMLKHRVITLGRPVPPEICPKIEEATEGKITRHDLRPDLFGPPPKAGNGKKRKLRKAA